MIKNQYRESFVKKAKSGNFSNKFSNIQLLIIGFVVIILIGSVVLSLPISSKIGGGGNDI